MNKQLVTGIKKRDPELVSSYAKHEQVDVYFC